MEYWSFMQEFNMEWSEEMMLFISVILFLQL